MSRQMAPWVPLFQQSCKNNLNDLNQFTPFQFSTSEILIDKDGNIKDTKPRVRTVVLRDFLFNDKRTNVLTFHSDLRSQKLKVAKNQRQYFESCFYFPGTYEQYRISGEWFNISLNGNNYIDDHKLTKYGILIKESIMSDEMSNEIVYRFPECNDWKEEVMRQWNGLSRAAKALYRKPAPGEIMTTETSKKLDKIQRGVDGAKEDAGLENFTVICLLIDQVDYLNLKDGRGGERRIFKRCCDAILSKKDLKEVRDEEAKREEYDDDDDDDECEILSEHEVWTEIEVCP